MKTVRRLLVAAAILSVSGGGQGIAATDNATPAGNMPALKILAKIGPWPALSALIGFRGRLWFANSVRYPDHNSADLYSLGLASGDVRFERHLFSQDVGEPTIAGGLLYWPYEDPRPSVGWGHIAVTDGKTWRLRVMPGGPPMFHVHAMEKLDGRLYAATSAWRAGLHVSTDGGLRWRQIYDRPTPKRKISRIIALAGEADDILPALNGTYDIVHDDGWFGAQPAYYDRLADLVRPGGLLVMSNWFLLEHAVTGQSPVDWAQFAGPTWAADVKAYARHFAADERYDVSFVQNPAVALAYRRSDA